MIDAQTMIDKMGKKAFVDLATKSQNTSQTGASLQHAKRWGRGRICMQYCGHGIKTIDNFEPTGLCKLCATENRTSSGEFHPYFNVGLGGWVESRSDERKSAKRMGLREAG